MNTLDRISLSQLSYSMLDHLATTTLSFVDSLAPDPYVERQLVPINAALSILRQLKGRQVKSDLTPQISEADEMVDSLLPMLEDALKNASAQRLFIAERADSADRVLALLKQCDRTKLFYGGYSDQGAELATLFQKVFAPENRDYLAKAGVAAICTALQEHNEKLHALREARLNEESFGTTSREQLGILRHRLEALLTYIDTNIADEVDGFPPLQQPLNELIGEVMAEYRASVTRKCKAVN